MCPVLLGGEKRVAGFGIYPCGERDEKEIERKKISSTFQSSTEFHITCTNIPMNPINKPFIFQMQEEERGKDTYLDANTLLCYNILEI